MNRALFLSQGCIRTSPFGPSLEGDHSVAGVNSKEMHVYLILYLNCIKLFVFLVCAFESHWARGQYVHIARDLNAKGWSSASEKKQVLYRAVKRVDVRCKVCLKKD